MKTVASVDNRAQGDVRDWYWETWRHSQRSDSPVSNVTNFSALTLYSTEGNKGAEMVPHFSPSLLQHTLLQRQKHHLLWSCMSPSELRWVPAHTHANWETAHELCPGSALEGEDPCRRRCNEARDISRALLLLDRSRLVNTLTHTNRKVFVCFRRLQWTLNSAVTNQNQLDEAESITLRGKQWFLLSRNFFSADSMNPCFMDFLVNFLFSSNKLKHIKK